MNIMTQNVRVKDVQISVNSLTLSAHRVHRYTLYNIYCGDQPPSPHQINKTNDNYSGGAIKYDIKSIILKSIVRGRFAFQNQLIRLGRSIDRST